MAIWFRVLWHECSCQHHRWDNWVGGEEWQQTTMVGWRITTFELITADYCLATLKSHNLLDRSSSAHCILNRVKSSVHSCESSLHLLTIRQQKRICSLTVPPPSFYSNMRLLHLLPEQEGVHALEASHDLHRFVFITVCLENLVG